MPFLLDTNVLSELRSPSLIAATALVHGLTVATRNVRDFKKTGGRLVNPFS